MVDLLLPFLRTFLNAILIASGGFLLAFIISRVTNRFLEKPLGIAWSRFIANLIGLGIGIWTIKLILDSTGAAGLVVVLVTAITGAFAIGSERSASDVVAGVNLFISKPYEVGDLVLLAGHEGRVSNVSLITTTLESLQGARIFIRNSDVSNNTIVNYSAKNGQLISVKVPLPVNQDLNKAVAAVEKAIQKFSTAIMEDEYHPSVVVESGNFGYIVLEVRAYVSERMDYGPEKTRLFTTAVDAIHAAGLTLELIGTPYKG